MYGSKWPAILAAYALAVWLYMANKPKKKAVGSGSSMSKEAQGRVLIALNKLLGSPGYGPNPSDWSGNSPSYSTGIMASTYNSKENNVKELWARYARAKGKYSAIVAKNYPPSSPLKQKSLFDALTAAKTDPVWRAINLAFAREKIGLPAWKIAEKLGYVEPSSYLVLAIFMHQWDNHQSADDAVLVAIKGVKGETKQILAFINWWEKLTKERAPVKHKMLQQSFNHLRQYATVNPQVE